MQFLDKIFTKGKREYDHSNVVYSTCTICFSRKKLFWEQNYEFGFHRKKSIPDVV